MGMLVMGSDTMVVVGTMEAGVMVQAMTTTIAVQAWALVHESDMSESLKT